MSEEEKGQEEPAIPGLRPDQKVIAVLQIVKTTDGTTEDFIVSAPTDLDLCYAMLARATRICERMDAKRQLAVRIEEHSKEKKIITLPGVVPVGPMAGLRQG